MDEWDKNLRNEVFCRGKKRWHQGMCCDVGANYSWELEPLKGRD